jgi:hypothetical protein
MRGEIIENEPGLETGSASIRQGHHGHRSTQPEAFPQGPDPSIHILALPESIPRFRTWFAIAVATGILFALSIIFATNL